MNKVTMPEPFLLVSNQPWGGHAEVISSARGEDGVIDCYSAEQMEAYAAAKMREALQKAIAICDASYEQGMRDYKASGFNPYFEGVCGASESIETKISALLPN